MKCLFWLATAGIWFCCNAIGVLSGQVLTAGFLQDKGYSLPGGAKGMYPLVSSCQENGDRPIKRENPHKYLLYKPTFSQIMVFLASGEEFCFCLVWPLPLCLCLPLHLPFNISLFCLPVCNLDFISTSNTLLPFGFFYAFLQAAWVVSKSICCPFLGFLLTAYTVRLTNVIHENLYKIMMNFMLVLLPALVLGQMKDSM